MDFNDVQNVLRRLELPEGGFDDVLVRLGELKGRKPVGYAETYLRRKQGKIGKAKGLRAV